jgi:hypothetical protein
MEDFAEIAGLEPVVTDGETEPPDFKQQPCYNEIYHHLATRLRRLQHAISAARWEPVEQLLDLQAILKAASAPPPAEKMLAEALFPIEIPSAEYRTSRQVTPLSELERI